MQEQTEIHQRLCLCLEYHCVAGCAISVVVLGSVEGCSLGRAATEHVDLVLDQLVVVVAVVDH